MSILKNILIAIGVILAIALIGIYFLPSSYVVTRTILVERPPEMVFERVTNYETWSDWDPWHSMEPESERKFTGEPGKPGHAMSWVGEKVGVGSLTIETASVEAGVKAKLAFVKPFKSEADDIWQFEKVDNGTKVSWISQGALDYPIGRLFGLTVESMLGPQKEQGLEKLKVILELPHAAEIEEILKQATEENNP